MRYNRLFIILICLISYTAITAQTVTVADTLKARKGLVVAGKTITSITETVNGSSTTKQVPTALSVWNALSGYLSAGTSFSGDVSGVYSNLQIGANAVGSTEIAANAVSEAKIGTGQVTTTKIADGAVTTAKIADANVTMAKIAQSGASTGQAIVWSGTGWAPATISGGGGGSITGSGTSGLITKWTGTTAIGNSIIQDNGVNVGVGKSPSFKLDVNSVINAVSHRFSGYSSQITEEAGRMLYYVNGSRLDFIDVTGSKFMGRFSDSELGLWNSNGSQQLSFGINTIGTGLGYYNGSFRIAQRLMVANSGTASARVHVIGEGQTSGTYTALFRNSNNDELFNIRDDKAVSVGTASPSSVAKFHVELDAVKTHMIVNYLGNTILSVRNDANVSFGSNAGSFAITTGTNSSAYNGQYFRFSAPSTSATLDNGGLGQVFVLGRSSSSTSGNTTYFSITSDNAFNPTSGNRSMTGFRVHPSINQTNLATGTIYGIDYDPGITSILGAHYGLLIRSGFSGFNTATPTATLDVNGSARFRSFNTAGNVFTHDASGNLTDITPASLISSGGGITGTAAANAVPYWNAGATTLTTGGMTKDATNLNLENGLGLKLLSPSAANMIINATATEGTIQTYGSVPLKLNPLGNGLYIGGLTGGTGKALSLSAAGLVGVIDVGSGTVTTTSIATANGFSGTVANPTTTPSITLSTTITGMLKGNGTALSAATAGTDYVTPSMSANQVITTGNYAFTLDATSASGISNPLVIKGKADGTNSTQAITFANDAGTAQSTVTVTNIGTYFSAVSGKNLILGVGTTGYLFKENGALQFQNLSVNPSASGNRGGLFYNSALDRFAYSDGTNNHYIAKLSDVSGSNTSYTSSTTLQAGVSTKEADANAGAIVITVDGTMTPDFTTLIRATRNNTNTVTITAGSGYVLKIDGDAAVTGTSYQLTAGEIVTVRRDSTKIFVNK